MRISEYPQEELQEWLDLPATRGFIEELEAHIQDIRSQYRLYIIGDLQIWKVQGREAGVSEVIDIIRNL